MKIVSLFAGCGGLDWGVRKPVLILSGQMNMIKTDVFTDTHCKYD